MLEIDADAEDDITLTRKCEAEKGGGSACTMKLNKLDAREGGCS